MRPAMDSLIEATWLSRSSARSTVSSTRAASVRTAVQRDEVRPWSVVRSSVVRSGSEFLRIAA